MKKIVLTFGLLLAVNGIAMADGNAFTPLNFNDTQFGNTNTIRRGMIYGKTAQTKKAIVKLTEGSKDIELFAGI